MLVIIMSKTATLNLRIDPETKVSAEKVLSQLGLSMSTAIEVYLRQIILNGEIPFYISSTPQEGTKRVLSLKEIREKAIPLAKQYGVKRLYLFGSYARGEAKPTSDVDFYIEKGKVEGLQLVSLQLDLEKALGKPVDLLTVMEKLRSTGDLDDVGGPMYIAKLCDTVTGSADVEYYAGIIAQKHLARQLITLSSHIQTLAFDETTDVANLLQEAEAKLFQITQESRRQDYTQIDPVVKSAYKMVGEAARRPDGLSGISCGFRDLDRMTSGWQNSDLIIIAARPAMGKTAFALSMAKKIAIDQGIPMALFSLEMSNVQLMNRVISNVCEIESEKLRNGQLQPYEWGQLDHSIKQLYGKPLFLDDTPGMSVFELRTKARRLVREHNIKILMIDYLQLMTASGNRFGSRQEEVSIISRSLKNLAKELNIPIIALSQLNRSVEQREGHEGKRPQLSDLRESGAIEQDADIVCFIHRPEYYKIYKDENGVDLHGKANIIIAKHRNGGVGDVLLTFKGKYARFENLDDDMVPAGYIQTDNGGAFELDSRINSEDGNSDDVASVAGNASDAPF